MTSRPIPGPLSATGRGTDHLCSAADSERLGAAVHRDVSAPFLDLRHAAAEEGFDLRILSGFRDFERQRSIWNRKAAGELPVLDASAEPLDIGRMSDRDLVFAILRWSALPGASRHHWGTDIDVYDENARPQEYEVDLIPAEVEEGGMFAPLHAWLDRRIAAGTSFGFFRPYDKDRGGVAPERWHLSHAPTARACEGALTVDILRSVIQTSDVALQDSILDALDDIYRRFVVNINREHP